MRAVSPGSQLPGDLFNYKSCSINWRGEPSYQADPAERISGWMQRQDQDQNLTIMALLFHQDHNETIAAIATGITESGIGIIRISGPSALAVGDKLYRNRKGGSGVSDWKANTIHFGYIVDPEQPDEPVDEVMVSIFRAPHSYTTEDTIEINCHGGVYLMNRILQLALANGCRMAEPGEFTKRAFLGGRIDLSRAEAVMELIESGNEFSRRTAMAQLEGSVSSRIRGLREKILYELAFIESALDDPEHYSLDEYPERLDGICEELIGELNQILAYSADGRILKDGIRTVLAGKPNAGKSSLMNCLSGEERAIVTEVAGTTRDTLEEKVRIGDVVLDLTDTAGIHDTSDQVERIGVDRAKAALERADLILFLIDGSEPLEEADREIADMISAAAEKGTRCIVLQNKADLPCRVTREQIGTLFPAAELLPYTGTDGVPKTALATEKEAGTEKKRIPCLAVSAGTGSGIPALKDLIRELFHTGEIAAKNEIFLSSLREQQEATAARDSLLLVKQSIAKGMSEDFFSIDLMSAYTSLGKILGEAVEDDLVEEIFSHFCLGK